jgi:zinc D-Ala-D-Ala carboxypeptidase
MSTKISTDFTLEEFSCKCGCGADHIDLMLVERLQAIRNAIKEPIPISCGVRCPKHNAEVGGVPNSAHVKGLAVDIKVSDSGFRYRLLRQAFKIFNRVEVADGPWVHLDMDPSLPQDVCFTHS